MIFGQTLGKKHKGQWPGQGSSAVPSWCSSRVLWQNREIPAWKWWKHLYFWLNASAQSFLIPSVPGGDGYGVSSNPTLRFCPQEGISWLLKHKGVLLFCHMMEIKVPRKSGCSDGISAWPACTPILMCSRTRFSKKSEVFQRAFIKNIILNHF